MPPKGKKKARATKRLPEKLQAEAQRAAERARAHKRGKVSVQFDDKAHKVTVQVGMPVPDETPRYPVRWQEAPLELADYRQCWVAGILYHVLANWSEPSIELDLVCSPLKDAINAHGYPLIPAEDYHLPIQMSLTKLFTPLRVAHYGGNPRAPRDRTNVMYRITFIDGSVLRVAHDWAAARMRENPALTVSWAVPVRGEPDEDNTYTHLPPLLLNHSARCAMLHERGAGAMEDALTHGIFRPRMTRGSHRTARQMVERLADDPDWEARYGEASHNHIIEPDTINKPYDLAPVAIHTIIMRDLRALDDGWRALRPDPNNARQSLVDGWREWKPVEYTPFVGPLAFIGFDFQ